MKLWVLGANRTPLWDAVKRVRIRTDVQNNGWDLKSETSIDVKRH